MVKIACIRCRQHNISPHIHSTWEGPFSRAVLKMALPALLIITATAPCVLSNGDAATAPKTDPGEHFPLIPDIPLSGSTTKARGWKGDTASDQVVGSFVLIMDNVTEMEDHLLRNDVVGEPLTSQDNNLGMYFWHQRGSRTSSLGYRCNDLKFAFRVRSL